MAEINDDRPIEIESGEKTLYGILRGFTDGISSPDGAAGSPVTDLGVDSRGPWPPLLFPSPFSLLPPPSLSPPAINSAPSTSSSPLLWPSQPSNPGSFSPPQPLVERVRGSFSKQVPHIREACRNSGQDLIRWTREGGPLRALLVISVGTISLVALSGLLAFTVFFLVATANAIIISALVSLAAVGGFLAFFFAFLTALYVGVLSLAIFVTSITTISMIIAVIVATGWIGFFYVVWLAAKKSMDLMKKSLSVVSSAVSVYSSSRHDRYEYDTPLKSPPVEVN